MTRQEFDQIVKATCPRCASGNVARQRTDTKEWVHDSVQPTGGTFAGARQGHTLCMATNLRNSDLAKEVTGG